MSPTPAVLEGVNTITTLAGQWFDPASLGIVLGGTILATLLRCGLAETRLALGKIGALATRPFDPAKAKAELAHQLRGIESDGLLRAAPVHFGDGEFDSLSDALANRRSIEGLRAEHEGHMRQRTESARTATHASSAASRRVEAACVQAGGSA